MIQFTNNKILQIKVLFLISTLYLFVSCSNKLLINKDSKNHFLHSSPYLYSLLILNNDSTFYLKEQYPNIIKLTTEGNWTYNHNHIVLNSFNRYLTDTIIVKESNKFEDDSLFIKVYDYYDNAPCNYGNIKLNDDSISSILDDNGETKFKKAKNPKTFIISTFNKEYIYQVKNPNATFFEVTIYDNPSYIFFKNELIKVKRNKLIRNKNLIYKRSNYSKW